MSSTNIDNNSLAHANGVITITENDEVVVIYISNIKQIISYVMENENIQTSCINNI